jgi:hypothetical protein
MSSLTLTTKFAKTFPKREAWYGGFFKPQKVRTHAVVLGVLSPLLFGVGMLVSLQVAVVAMQSYQPASAPVAVALPQVPAPEQSPLVASVASATQFFHVPGAYVDTSTVVPAIEAPQPLLSQQDVAAVADAWDKTFGLGGRVFVASVYEFGAQGASVTDSEVNVGEAWSAYINGLSDVLEPYAVN